MDAAALRMRCDARNIEVSLGDIGAIEGEANEEQLTVECLASTLIAADVTESRKGKMLQSRISMIKENIAAIESSIEIARSEPIETRGDHEIPSDDDGVALSPGPDSRGTFNELDVYRAAGAGDVASDSRDGPNDDAANLGSWTTGGLSWGDGNSDGLGE